jgi:hypothetical protein
MASIDPVRTADPEALALTKRLLSEARFATLATLDDKAHPFASLVSFALDRVTRPILLVSRLSGHTKHLLADPRCSLLVGEPGKGDPLAHPRITIQCRAEAIPKEADESVILKTLFLARHPKAALYADFPDFLFFRLQMFDASLNGGFGKAFHLTEADLAFRP